MASIRAKQSPTVNNNLNNKRAQLPYRTTNQYQRQYHDQQQTLSPSPIRDISDENSKQIINETKQMSDMELNMNCADDGLSDAQLANCPVKVNIFISEIFIDKFFVLPLGTRSNRYNQWSHS